MYTKLQNPEIIAENAIKELRSLSVNEYQSTRTRLMSCMSLQEQECFLKLEQQLKEQNQSVILPVVIILSILLISFYYFPILTIYLYVMLAIAVIVWYSIFRRD